jgi:hypothetical protein
MRSLGIRIGIVVLIVVAGLLLRPFLTGNAGDLKVGECFDIPKDTATTVKDVQHHPCTDTHGGEVVFVGKMTGADDAYPDEAARFQFVSANCVPAFSTYTGTDFAGQSTWDIGWFSPIAEGWKKGDRGVSCYAYRVDGTTTKASIKKS